MLAIKYPENRVPSDNCEFQNIDEMGDFPEPGNNKPVSLKALRFLDCDIPF